MRRSLTVAVAAAIIAAPIGWAAPATAADARAEGSWSMVPQSKDANDDGIIDGDGGVPRRGALSSQPSADIVGAGNHVAQPNERLIGGSLSWYLTDRGFPVRLDACASTGARYRWTARPMSGPSTVLPWATLEAGACSRTAFLPEGAYELVLEVRAGGSRDREVIRADVRNILVVALGDSYASGEGNPRNVKAWLREGGSFTPYWDDDACHRSARGGPAQAALLLEESSPTTSVTLVDVTCSGASVDAGVLGPQRAAGQPTSQVERARAFVGDRVVDLVTLSVGGNDVGFTSVLEACALNSDCPLVRASSGPLRAYPRIQDGVQAETGALAAKYRRIAACLGGDPCLLADGRTVPGIRLDADSRVLPTLYPDITRRADGSACTYLTIDSAEFAWARQTILVPNPVSPYTYPLSRGGTVSLSVAQGSLNQQVAATTALPGWRPVIGTWSASGESAVGHGVCAGDEAWAFGATLLSSLPSASFHPNVTGQRVAASALTAAMLAALPDATRAGRGLLRVVALAISRR
ncbi:MAG: GDSL-type esterase/lipase family protein [Actinomycetota bacterium]|nr:GDSL-type esterase/lipase family protein [Actinomycetota bacterium]